jgi:predicted O-methyltransferase YrrM
LNGRAPTLDLAEIYPKVSGLRVDLGAISYSSWNMDPTERFILGALAQIRSPSRIFEIGTFDGSATRVLARNARGATIDTLDLPVDHPASAVATGVLAIVGDYVRDEPSVHQHFGDSRTFDFGPWKSSVDLVLIDAGHLYEDVRADTEAALRMLSDDGVIVWDDYTSGWPGVVRAVDETGLDVFRVSGTELAIYDRRLGDMPSS